MPIVLYTQPDGVEKSVDVPDGANLMEAAVQNDVDGIDGECGGAGMCATCHVYIDEAFLSKLTAADEAENEMLDNTSSEKKPNSRLSCQIMMSDDLEGIKIIIPKSQS